MAKLSPASAAFLSHRKPSPGFADIPPPSSRRLQSLGIPNSSPASAEQSFPFCGSQRWSIPAQELFSQVGHCTGIPGAIWRESRAKPGYLRTSARRFVEHLMLGIDLQWFRGPRSSFSLRGPVASRIPGRSANRPALVMKNVRARGIARPWTWRRRSPKSLLQTRTHPIPSRAMVLCVVYATVESVERCL